MKKVGIIGGSGFIGSYNTKKFLQAGYNVKVSSTDVSKSEKYEHLKALPNADKMEIVQLNVEDKSQLADFIKGCNIVIHGGTPFQLNVNDPKSDLFDPTINGTKNFLEIVKNTPEVEKVVFIASVAAHNTNFPLPPDGKSPDDKMSENDDLFMSEKSHPYAQAKYLANQVVEDFVKNNPDIGFEITTISPVFVAGKSLSTRQDSTSTGMQYLFKNKIAPDPFVQMMYDHNVDFAMVDVEDVAEAVYRAATKKGLHGKKYLATSESYSVSDISLMLNKQNPEAQPKIIYINDLAKQDLGMKFKPAKESLFNY